MVHIPVLLQSALHYLNVQPQAKYIDATFGSGGHAQEIAKLGGQVLALDQDDQAIEAAQPALALYPSIKVINANFVSLSDVAKANSWQPVSGIIFDLGISSSQIDQPDRGFSFQSNGPLDMRMDRRLETTAQDLVNNFPPSQLEHIFKVFGEVTQAKNLVQKIISHRPFTTTLQLAKLMGKNSRQVFQALRIAVNDELGALEASLPQALDLLSPGGRLLVISFHSLEDRVVKHTFTQWANKNYGQILTSKPVIPNKHELIDNPRSHSAKLRVFQKND